MVRRELSERLVLRAYARFVMAENPVSRTWVQQVFLPLVPGVDTLLEPIQDQAEDAQVPLIACYDLVP